MSNPDGSQFLQEAIKLANVDPPDDFPSLDAASYIPANKDQIISLESNGNSSTDWTRVLITNQADASTLNRIRRCTFMGLIYISLLTGTIDEADGFSMPSGLYDTLFGGSCFIAPSCRVSSTSLVNNIFMGFASGIVDCGSVFCEEYKTVSTAPLGDQVTITVGSETGGRSVTVSAGMNFVTICKQIFCSEAKKDVQEGTFMSRYSVIGNHTIITRCDRIRNSHFGPRCRVSSSNLDCCILSSTLSKSITVSAGARLSHCIMNESCTASNGCLVDHLYMCENSSVGDCARIAHCVLGPDSSVAGGECHSSLLGPFVGFHHQSLLIASVWPQGRGNIAYGAKIGANHTGRVSDQECFPGEGIFFGLGSSIKFPSNLLESPYSIVASGTILPPQRISFPFSLIGSLDRPIKSRDGIILQGASTISPGWVIQSNPYMIDRAAKKYSGRRKARYHRTDLPIMRPWIVDLVLSARNHLTEALKTLNPDADPLEAYSSAEVPGVGLCLIAHRDLVKGVKAYTVFLQRYALHGLLYLMLRIKGSETKERSSFIDSLRSRRHSVLVSRSPGWGSLMKDIELLEVSDLSAISSCDAVASAFQVSCLVSNSSDMDVLVHQLHVLTEEFPTAGLDSALGDWTSSGYEGAHLTDSFGALAFLLEDLCRLESAHASAVNSCRARDGIKGREVIPDYDEVNAAGGECLSDPIAKRALDQAGEVSDAVAMLCDGNAYTTKMRLCH